MNTKFLDAERLIVFETCARLVPEIANNTLEIVNIARIPKYGSIIAVKANKPTLDAVGVFSKEGRGRVLARELGNEKIRVVLWSDNDLQLIANIFIGSRSVQNVCFVPPIVEYNNSKGGYIVKLDSDIAKEWETRHLDLELIIMLMGRSVTVVGYDSL